MRWFLWLTLVPQLFLLSGWLTAIGAPPVDFAAGICLFCVLFAERSALPGLLLGAALGRSLVDGGGLAVQVLTLGTPVALLLPLRGLLFRQRWVWQGLFAAVLALAIPRLHGFYGALFRQAETVPALDGFRVAWSVLLLPPLLWLLCRLPPLRQFREGPR
jgi:hypothetical protein